jgi:hypothetical protein
LFGVHPSTHVAWRPLYATGRRYLRLEDWRMDGTINFMVAKIVKVEQQRISIVGGVRYWADSPDTGPHGFGGRLGMTFLFPAR